KGSARLPPEELVGCTAGLIALSGCRQGEVAQMLRADEREQALDAARHMRRLFGPAHFYIELQNHLLPDDRLLVRRLTALASYLELGCVVTNNVHYATRAGHRLQDVLVCIREGVTLEEAHTAGGGESRRRLNSEYHLKAGAEMATLFPEHSEALANTLRIAERCRFVPRYGLQELPHFPTPGGMSSSAYLRRLCEEGLIRHYGDPPDRAHSEQARLERVRDGLARELAVIEGTHLANYFLIVADIVRFARESGIRCQGRGSAAGSLVAYLLGIGPVDPLAHDLVFERFLSEERLQSDAGFLPDIDLDFDAARREEVIQYVYRTYGAAHTAMACTFSTYRRRSALRDVGKALGVAPSVVAAARWVLEGEEDEMEGDGALLLGLAREIKGFPRHLGIHSGGMVITGAPLMGRVPTEPATMADRVVVQWDKEGLEAAGLVKIDLLGLRMLSAITETLDLIEETQGRAPDLSRLTFDDPDVYVMLAAGETMGVFQVESRAQSQLQPRLRPRCFNDLVVSISMIRPGPLHADMLHPYLRRRQGLEPVAYPHPLLESALEETLGVIVFQEQVLKVARDLAGFTPGQGEQLRRALGAKRGQAELARLRAAFMQGTAEKGVDATTAEKVFSQLQAFGGYAFPKSHAAAFAVLVYQSAWLRRYHFLPFFTALLNNQPMGFWPASALVGEIKRYGHQVLPVDVRRSSLKCTLEAGALRLGLGQVSGWGEALGERLLAAREECPFTSLADLWQRVRPGRRALEKLIMAGALDGWGLPRRHLLWELGTLEKPSGALALDFPAGDVELPPLSPLEATGVEESVMGLSAGEHPLAFLRSQLASQGFLSCEQLATCRDGERVRLAGRLVIHQAPPTANGIHFLTLEDETGMVDVIVWPSVYERYRRVLHEIMVKLVVEGRVQRSGAQASLLMRSAATF
ncbi:MAG: error-prone DNA polymerase, partial [Candidatus Promineifilaceae bacterium]|nr:error-prone DNA polymerase [Candidatus Promineifilaceae bacterium]